MAIPLSVGDVVEVTFEGRQAGQQVMVLLHYRVREGENADFATWFNGAFAGWLQGLGRPYTEFVNNISQDVDSLRIYGQIIYPQRRRYIQAVPGDVSGQIISAALPPNDSAAIIKQGELARRDNIGVMHLPGIPAINVTDGVLNAGYQADLQGLADSLAQVYEPGGGEPVLDPVLYRRDDPSSGAVIVSAYVGETSRIIRRRTVGLGA